MCSISWRITPPRKPSGGSPRCAGGFQNGGHRVITLGVGCGQAVVFWQVPALLPFLQQSLPLFGSIPGPQPAQTRKVIVRPPLAEPRNSLATASNRRATLSPEAILSAHETGVRGSGPKKVIKKPAVT